MKLEAPPTIADYQRPPAPGAREGGSRPPPGPAEPLVSIVTVVYQGARYLQQTIDSVVAQTYPAIEYIIIDGGSTDGTLDILARNDHHITYWRSEPDRGIYDAMNKGIALARGQLIKLLNADDLLCSDSVAQAVTAYHDGAGRGAVIKSDIEIVDEHGRFIKLMTVKRTQNPLLGVFHPSWYVDVEVYRRAGLYDPSFRVAADYDLFLRLRAAGVPMLHVATPLIRFRTGGASSGLRGVGEGFVANRAHLGTWTALQYLFTHGLLKVRGRLLRFLFDDHTLARIQAMLGSRARPGR